MTPSLGRLFKRPVTSDLAIIDPVFPQKEPLAFRNSEINEYLKRVSNCVSLTMHPMTPGPDAWFTHGYGVDAKQFDDNKAGYLRYYPQNADRIKYLDPNATYDIKLAYSFFLAETYVLLPFYEQHKIPFVFVLYPGGAFGLHNASSDAMLAKIFGSPQFRAVIVTQAITRDYLLEQKLCSATAIHYIYGGFVQFKSADVKPKRQYGRDKQTFDICFVAAKYSERGVDKGYDLFIETARKLVKQVDDIRFHVIGGFDEQEIDVSDLGDAIKFYGYRRPDFLADFYAGMDIFLTPNRPGKLFEGNFDGFPLGIDAGYCGVALFTADELGMNRHYHDGKDIVIVPNDAGKIARRIMDYYKQPGRLYELSDKGRGLTQELFDIDRQIEARLDVFKQFVDLDIVKGGG